MRPAGRPSPRPQVWPFRLTGLLAAGGRLACRRAAPSRGDDGPGGEPLRRRSRYPRQHRAAPRSPRPPSPGRVLALQGRQVGRMAAGGRRGGGGRPGLDPARWARARRLRPGRSPARPGPARRGDASSDSETRAATQRLASGPSSPLPRQPSVAGLQASLAPAASRPVDRSVQTCGRGAVSPVGRKAAIAQAWVDALRLAGLGPIRARRGRRGRPGGLNLGYRRAGAGVT